MDKNKKTAVINLAIFCGAIMLIAGLIYYFNFYWQGDLFEQKNDFSKGRVDSPGANVINLEELE